MALTATVDNVEGERARLRIGEKEVDFSLSELPEGAVNSDVPRFEFTHTRRTEAAVWKEPGREEG